MWVKCKVCELPTATTNKNHNKVSLFHEVSLLFTDEECKTTSSVSSVTSAHRTGTLATPPTSYYQNVGDIRNNENL